MIKTIDAVKKDAFETAKMLRRRKDEDYALAEKSVYDIIKNVRERGDGALLEYTQLYDNVRFESPDLMAVTEKEIEQAYNVIDGDKIAVIKRAAERIYRFHEKQKQNSMMCTDEKGVFLGSKITPMDRIGAYIPGGTAAYPSSVLMNVLPAKAAGVKEIILCTPPDTGGGVNLFVLAAAKICGVNKIYKAGGAQAIAAMAYGTKTIPKTDKIVGPGNIYVALAKRAVYSEVDIDSVAGPSEILIIADDSANPLFAAADLMAQAEHDKNAAAILVSTSESFIEKVKNKLGELLEKAQRSEIISLSLKENGALVLADSMEKAIDISNAYAPEHLEIMVKNPFDFLNGIRHAGAIFLGHYTPEAAGDYVAGPNHVLPTGGTARFSSPLSTGDFYKKSSVICYSKGAFEKAYHDIAIFAEMEGLFAHAKSAKLRFSKNEGISED